MGEKVNHMYATTEGAVHEITAKKTGRLILDSQTRRPAKKRPMERWRRAGNASTTEEM
jgi:hypothetical protein